MSGREMQPDLLERESHLRGESIYAEHHFCQRDYPAHFHEYFEIELIASGRGYQILNGRKLSLSPGTIYLLTPEDIHNLHPEEPMDIYCVAFSEDFLLKNLSFDQIATRQSQQIHLSAEHYAHMTTLMQMLCQESQQRQKPYSHVYMQGLLSCTLVELLRCSGDSVEVPADNSAMQQVLFYMMRHFREPITMENMAQFAHLSPGYFSKTFKKTTGHYFVDYLHDMRVRYASRLLLSSNKPVTEVCYQSGFNSFSTFSRAFKKHFGVAPTDYRKCTEHHTENSSK